MPLHPESERVLQRLLAWRGAARMSVAEARDTSIAHTAAFSGAPKPVHEVAEIEIPGPAGPIEARVYRPRAEVPKGILVYLHGGGFALGTLAQSDVTCRALALASDCVVVAPAYRLAPEFPFPAGAEDCYTVVSWAACHAEQLGAPGAPIAVGGESAGGCLTATVTLLARERGGPDIACQVLIYAMTSCRPHEIRTWPDGVTAFPPSEAVQWLCDLYLQGASPDNPLASPLVAPSLEELPPALVITAEYDALRVEGEQYADRLRQVGVPVTVRRYPGMLHGFLEYGGLPGLAASVDRCVTETGSFLAETLGPTATRAPAAVSLPS